MTRPRAARKPTREIGGAFHTLVDALPDAILVIDAGSVAYANPAMHRLLGEPDDPNLTGRRLADLVAPEDHVTVALVDAASDGRSLDHRLEVKWRRVGGTHVLTECAIGRVAWNGRRAVQIVARDVTQRSESEEAIRRAGASMVDQLNEGRTELTESNRLLRSEAVRRERAEVDRDAVLARLAVIAERERGRLSRELHDEAGQHLTNLLLGLQGIIDVAGIGSEVDTRARALHSLAQRLGSNLHDVAVRLRPKALDDFGIEAALKSYATLWSRETGIEAHIQTTGRSARLPEGVETALYRIAQEALTNVARHSAAVRVSVVLHKGDDVCRMAIEDDGRGFDSASARVLEARAAGLGLLGMRERARLLGGRVDIESVAGVGTSVFVRIPTARADTAPDSEPRT